MKLSLTENIDLYTDLDLDIRKDSSTSTGLVTTGGQVKVLGIRKTTSWKCWESGSSTDNGCESSSCNSKEAERTHYEL